VRPLAGAAHPAGPAHRNAHYLLVLLTAGELHLTLDFEALTLRAPALLLVSPSQVHQLRGAAAPQGWGASFEPSLVAEEVRTLLKQGLRQPLPPSKPPGLTGAGCDALGITRRLPARRCLRALPWPRPASPASGTAAPTGRSARPAHRLHRGGHYPRAGAAHGLLPVSRHLQARTILEAKRLLYYSDQPVKQVGYVLGYEEPVYFGKVFKKVAGLTPQQFRHAIRE
jgi:AraC family transcriptional activator of pobA